MEKKPYARIDFENCDLDYDYTICEFSEVGSQLESFTIQVEDLDEKGFNEWKDQRYLPTATVSVVMLTDEEFEKAIESYDK